MFRGFHRSGSVGWNLYESSVENEMAGAESLELTTCGFGDRCSTN